MISIRYVLLNCAHRAFCYWVSVKAKAKTRRRATTFLAVCFLTGSYFHIKRAKQMLITLVAFVVISCGDGS